MGRAPRILLLLLLAALAGPRFCESATWSSFIRPMRYTDALVSHDTLWLASLEGGLRRYDILGDRFDAFTRQRGALASNALTSLAMDRSGKLWIGTLGDGLSRLGADRQTWDLVSVLDGLPTDSITTLRADGDSVWIGTSGGIALWDGRGVAGAIPDGVNPSPFANNDITGIVHRGDSLWVSTPAGVYVANLKVIPPTFDAVTSAGLFSPNIIGLADDGTRVMAWGDNLSYYYNFGAGQWFVAGNQSVIGNVVRLADDAGVVTATTNVGLFRWNTAVTDYEQLAGWPIVSSLNPDSLDRVFAVATDAHGTTWAADVDGVYEQAAPGPVGPLHVVPAPPGNNIINLGLDGPRLYVISYTEGIGRYDGTTWRNWPPVGCSGAGCDTTFRFPIFTFSYLRDHLGHKWIGCWSGPNEEFDDLSDPPQFIHHVVADTIPAPDRHTFTWATALDNQAGRWFSLETNNLTDPPTAIGLDYYDSNGAFVRNFRPENTANGMVGSQIRGLVFDPRRSRFWIGYTGQGVQHFDWPPTGPNGTPQFITLGLSQNFYVQSIAINGDSLWILTTKDLYRYNAASADSNPIESFPVPGATVQNAVHPMDIGPDGSVWLGSENGVRVYRRNGLTTDYTTATSPLVSDQVRSIRVDPQTGVVWIGTTSGITRFDPFYVPPPPPRPPTLKVAVFPNPGTLTALGVSLRVLGNGSSYHGEVYDLNGRRVRRFAGISNGRVFWDGHDDNGVLVRPGVYFVRIEAEGRESTARVALLR